MNGIFKIVLSLSLSGSLLILVLFLCKPLIKNKLSKGWQYYIWLIVIARLLLPFTPETSLVGTLFQEIDRTIGQSVTVPALEQPQDARLPPQVDDNTLRDEEPVKTTRVEGNTFPIIIVENLWVVWLVTALILLTRKITIYQGFVRYLMAGRTEVASPELLDRVAEISEKNGVKRPVELYTNGLVSSPLLLGFFHPCIVLPTADLPEKEFEFTILHELIHYRRRDMFYKWLVQLTVCLHWFNPLIYAISHEINRACELACDEAIVCKLNFPNQRSYGDTLINALGAGGRYRDSLASVTLSESKDLLKERLEAIMKYKKRTAPAAVFMVLYTILFCLGATATGAYGAAPSSPSTAPWNAMGESGQSYTYSQASYYEAPYLFELGWNLNEKGYNSYPDKAKIVLSSQNEMMVSFDKSCKDFINNDKALSNLNKLLETLRSQSEDSSLPLEKPLILSVEDIGNSDLRELAEKYYTSHTVTRFVAVFPSLDSETQKSYCDKMFAKNENAFFAATLKVMGTDLINFYADKAYRENKLTYFTNIVPYLTDDMKQFWIVKSSQDKRNTFQAVLTGK